MKIVIAPDSYKHSMSADEICRIAESAILDVLPQAGIVKLPAADGGEGTAGALLSALGGESVPCRVKGAEFDLVDSSYALLNNNTAVIEMASVCGLMMVQKPNPEKTTTFGVGQMIKKALDDGCEKLILCIGGSATNDAGIGAMAALGARFLDAEGEELIPNGENLIKITAIDSSGIDPRLGSCELLIACDVNNPLYGENGAAYVFAPQKGADGDMVKRLDAGLKNYAEVLYRETKRDIASIPGAGAAGGFAASFLAFPGAVLKPGVDIVLDALDFDDQIKGADLILTGEGKTDSQTLSGKTILGVSRRAKLQNIPVIVISGSVDDEIDGLLYREGVCAIFANNRLARPFDEIKDKDPVWLKLTVTNIMKTYFHRNDQLLKEVYNVDKI